jgi:hypothetical protein
LIDPFDVLEVFILVQGVEAGRGQAGRIYFKISLKKICKEKMDLLPFWRGWDLPAISSKRDPRP